MASSLSGVGSSDPAEQSRPASQPLNEEARKKIIEERVALLAKSALKNDPYLQADLYAKRVPDTELFIRIFPDAIKLGYIDVVAYLIDKGVSLQELDSAPRAPLYQNSPLYQAITSGQEKIALLLIEKGANIYLECDGGSLMNKAIDYGQPRVVIKLIEKGFNVDSNLLGYAATGSHPEVLWVLLKYGAKEFINAPNSIGDTALVSAIKFARPGNVKVLVDNKADLSLKCENFNMLQLAKNRLNRCEYSYQLEHGFWDSELMEKTKREIKDRQAIVEYLEKAMPKS